MKPLLLVLVLVVTPLLAEPVTLKQPVLLKSGRNAATLKAGTVVDLISRDGTELTIKYKELTGKIPASALQDAKPAATGNRSGAEKKAEKKATESKPANPPQTNYGKAVQKAKDNAAAHDKNLVKPADDVLKDR